MFNFREDISINIENQKEFASEIGIAKETLCRLLARKQSCSKVIAYAITKHLNSNYEIKDIFERVD